MVLRSIREKKNPKTRIFIIQIRQKEIRQIRKKFDYRKHEAVEFVEIFELEIDYCRICRIFRQIRQRWVTL